MGALPESARTTPAGRDAFLAEVAARAATCGREATRRALFRRLAIRPSDAVLELGFGSGRLLAEAAARARHGFAAGVEPSEWALRHARRRCARGVAAGRVALHRGASDDLSHFEAARFDKVYGVHVAYFWSDPQRDLAEIARVLRPQGTLVLGFCPQRGLGEESPCASVARLEAELSAAGFAGVHTELAGEGPRTLAWTVARR
jgi:ubiquinone/menaquinone biosynthesis C-methylase UbiE